MKEKKEQEIDLDLVTPCKFNPRKTFEKVGLKELQYSIAKQGVLQAILVRVRQPEDGSTSLAKYKYEIICGERRYRAALAAGLKQIPARVVVMDDKAALEVQVIENQQRADLHPLEEAEGYELLMKKHRESVEEIAAKVGKSKDYVYKRLKLCELVPDCRNMFYEGKLTPSTASLIARMPKDVQKEAAEKITEETYNGDMISLNEAKDIIQRDYMLDLKDVPFDKDDKICSERGSCSTCQKRTKNQELLFADIKDGDKCTDASCFNAKKEALVTRQIEKSKNTGLTVIKSETVFGACGSTYVQNGYVSTKDKCWKDEKTRTYKDLLKGHPTIKPVLAVDSKGTIHEVVKESDALKAIKEMGVKISGNKGDRLDDRKDKELKDAVHNIVTDRLMNKIKSDSDESFWTVLAASTHFYDDASCFMAKRIIPGTKRNAAYGVIQSHVKKLKSYEARNFVIEAYLAAQTSIPDLCELYGISEKAIEKEVKEKMSAPKVKAKK